MDLFFPRPAGTGTVPSQPDRPRAHHDHAHQAEASSSSSSRRQPPRNFAEARSLAREIRAPKTPFVTKRAGAPNATGKERDLASCSQDQLVEMLERNTRLIQSP